MTSIEPFFELSRRTRVYLILTVSLILGGVVVAAGSLLVQDRFLGDSAARATSGSIGMLCLVGLIAGFWAVRSWYLDGKIAHASTLKLGWFHAVMSSTNRLTLRRPNPVELFEGVCEVCVREGHLDMAVVDLSGIGEVHRSTAQGPVPAVTPDLLLNGALVQTLMMTLALNSGKLAIIDDASLDERLAHAQLWVLATGLLSLAAIPLMRAGVPVGILLLHSKQRAFFDSGVGPLAAELGADLSFALDNAERERERHSALLAERARSAAEEAKGQNGFPGATEP